VATAVNKPAGHLKSVLPIHKIGQLFQASNQKYNLTLIGTNLVEFTSSNTQEHVGKSLLVLGRNEFKVKKAPISTTTTG
jgi:hypothetical protein